MDHHPIRVRLVFPGRIPPETAVTCLTDEEKARATRFKFEKDAVSWAAYRGRLREILGHEIGLPAVEVPLEISETGKPRLAIPHDWLDFNLSHCNGLALVALSKNGPVGIDLEPRDRAETLLGCEMSFCHPEEIKALPADDGPRARQLLHIWTAKEAILKALGTGLTHPPESVKIHFQGVTGTASSEIPLEGIGNLIFQKLSHPDLKEYQAVLAMSATAGQFEIC